ncbi:9-O-acetylesterase [Limosilactobacillus sp. Lr3000]|uniref:9-O-acetylesterase n=1 Tax=Limosilactobacillus albertensis TaxID=2759752 RepID=A0A839H0H8_9LACO|nr:sialate O-acetylesterase [Limosilactobacillus albertensis]MBB1123973.1 9-O-acetylesterase [Limosilactobacillus albertensis]
MEESPRLKLSSLLSDGAILQRNKINTLWGNFKRNALVTIKFEDKVLSTICDANGKFKLDLPAHEAGGPFELIITSLNEKVVIKKVYFGDVWLLAGQSNMQLMFNRLLEKYPKELSKAKDKLIHYFKVPEHYQFNEPMTDIYEGKWFDAIKNNLLNVSGIGYFFAKYLRKYSNVPIGIVQTAVGGTSIRSWVSEEVLKTIGEMPHDYDTLKNQDLVNHFVKESNTYQDQYEDDRNMFDYGLKGSWAKNSIDSTWQSIDINKDFPEKFKTSGVVWLKTTIEVPENMVNQDAILHLGTLIDADETFVNGKKIGEVSYQYPPRHYKIGKIKRKVEITIRLKIDQKIGGFRKGKNRYIQINNNILDLNKCNWFAKRGCSMPSRKQCFFPQYLPSGLFNGMIYPLRNFSFNGIIWYQGESDTHEPVNYGKVFIKLIQEWRKIFSNVNLPFLFVQLPNCGIEPNHNWGRLRSEQEKALILDNTGMAVTIGDGEDNDLHPLNKKVVAKKLFELSERIKKWTHGCASGPIADQAYLNNDGVVIKFNTFGRKLVIDERLIFKLSQCGTLYTLNKFQVNDENIVVKIPEDIKIKDDAVISYAQENTAHPNLFDTDRNCAAPFKLKINNYYHIPSVLTHVLEEM